MLTIKTLGPLHKRTHFEYGGSVAGGATIHFQNSPPAHITAAFFRAILNRFQGQTVRGGFNMTDPPLGGFGEWVRDNGHKFNDSHLTPRHASFIAAILAHEGLLTSELDGNAVVLHFK